MAEMLSLSHDLIFCSLPLQRVDKKTAQEKKVCLYFSEAALEDWIHYLIHWTSESLFIL